MEEKRKIVIPIAEPETPQFDAEETLMSARPVVPLPEVETPRVSAQTSRSRAPFYKRFPFLAFIIIAATGAGLAAGLGIARYRYQQRVAAPVVTQPAPAPSDARTATITPKENAQAPQLPEVKPAEKATSSDESAKNGAAEKKPETTDGSAERGADEAKSDETAKATKPTTRDKNRTDTDVENENTTRVPEKKRRPRDNQGNDDTLDVQRQIERTTERINRIREIFEGQTRP